MRAETEMLDSLTSVLGATEEESVGAGRGPGGNLINGENLTTGLLDASTGGGGEAESGDRELGEIYEPLASYDSPYEAKCIPRRRLSSVTVPT